MKGGGNDSHTKGGKNDKNKNNCNKSIKDIINGDTVTFQDDRGTGQGAGQGEGADARYV